MNHRILVLGDLIEDDSRFHTATRLCPEAPAPVLVEQNRTTTPGGAGLVHAQLVALGGPEIVSSLFGSTSKKTRIFADGHLICRIDQDTQLVDPDFGNKILLALEDSRPDLIIVSDYGKGGFDLKLACKLMDWSRHYKIPVLVDAKQNWTWFNDCFACFPNQRESKSLPVCSHVIQKLGADGCEVDGAPVKPERVHQVIDSTGAGDVFLAAFAYALLDFIKCSPYSQSELIECAKFANKIAGKSVEFLGTRVIENLG